jgi:choline dehydrogenase-like flavoprotein
VLALGGLEVPRLLLASNTTHRAGLGNQHDLVGRFFMEHLSHDTGVLRPNDPDLLNHLDLYEQRFMRLGHPIQGTLSVSNEVVRNEGLRNATFWVQPSYEERARTSVTSARALVSQVRRRPLMRGIPRHLVNLASDPLSLARVAVAEKSGRHPRPSVLRFRVLAEQAPNPNSRVTLADRRDQFDMPLLQVDWKVSDDDLDSIYRHQAILDRTFRRSKVGVIGSWLAHERPTPTMIGNAHHLGTTRMHRNERMGVVNEDSRVHGVGNLYIAGSSVFPTGGYANPTLTIIALAIRLADHIRQERSAAMTPISASLQR